MAAPPLAEGEIRVEQGQIVAVGQHLDPAAIDLGDVAIIPGLINAHAHLELSDLPQPLGTPGTPLPEWLPLVVRYRRSGQWNGAIGFQRGLAELSAAGVAAVADVVQPDWSPDCLMASSMPGNWAAPPQGVALVELLAPGSSWAKEAIAKARSTLDRPPARADWQLGLCPHTPYTVHPRLFDWALDQSRRRGLLLGFHLAESSEELQLLAEAAGPMRHTLEQRGAYDPETLPGRRRPLDYLRGLAEAHRALVIHGNYLADDEIAFLAEHRDMLSVVYCPRTHAFFGHRPYPLLQMLAAGASVAIGTDSRASSPSLALWEDLRLVRSLFPSLASETVLELGTLAGAKALRLDRTLGTLESGKSARLAVVALGPGNDPYARLFTGGTACNLT